MKNKAESKVRRELRKLGFTLSKQQNERKQGTDIVAMKNGVVLNIEVKEATLHNRAWQVDSVYPKQRIVCNTIAIVVSHGIILEPMSQHLKLCGKDGRRYITEYVALMKVTNGALKGRQTGLSKKRGSK